MILIKPQIFLILNNSYATLAVTRFESLPTSYNSLYPFQQYLTQLQCLTNNRDVSDRTLVGMTSKQQSNELFVNVPSRGSAMWVLKCRFNAMQNNPLFQKIPVIIHCKRNSWTLTLLRDESK